MRPGAPTTFSAEQWCQIIALACEPPEASDRPISHWTPRELADEARKREIEPIELRPGDDLPSLVSKAVDDGADALAMAGGNLAIHAPAQGTDETAQFYYDNIRTLVGEGHNQYVDDGFTSPDGRVVYFSRPSFADVVAIDLKTKQIKWRAPVDGYRSDHMAISADGSTELAAGRL